MSIEKQLKNVFEIIIQEVKNNQEFAKKIEVALGEKDVESKCKKRVREEAVIDPNAILIKGEEILKNELEKLEVGQLKDIIYQYTMDPAKVTSRWRSKDRLIKYIVEVTLVRSKKGEAFR